MIGLCVPKRCVESLQEPCGPCNSHVFAFSHASPPRLGFLVTDSLLTNRHKSRLLAGSGNDHGYNQSMVTGQAVDQAHLMI